MLVSGVVECMGLNEESRRRGKEEGAVFVPSFPSLALLLSSPQPPGGTADPAQPPWAMKDRRTKPGRGMGVKRNPR